MRDVPNRPAPGLLARGLKLIGHLTSPETRSGRIFNRVEQRLTRLSNRLNESQTWLRIAGTAMRLESALRIRRHALLERILRAVRLPPASEVQQVREQVRRLSEQVEAISSQLETVVALLERDARDRRPDVPRERTQRPVQAARG